MKWLFIIFIFVRLSAQINTTSQTDTIFYNYLYYQKCVLRIGEKGPTLKKYNVHSLSMSGGKYYLNGTSITKEKYDKLDSFETNVCENLYEKLSYKYFKFFIKDTIIKLEGRWCVEFWKGVYKEYYDNGGLKIRGFYYDGDNVNECGNPEGIRYFYNRKGKLKKVIDYNKKSR